MIELVSRCYLIDKQRTVRGTLLLFLGAFSANEIQHADTLSNDNTDNRTFISVVTEGVKVSTPN